MGDISFGLKVSGPVFDGRAGAAMADAADAIRERLARDGERLVTAAFTGQIRDNKGVFLSTITAIDVTHVFTSVSSWMRDTDEPGGGKVRVTRTYTMPIVVTDPANTTIVTSELATYGPWLEGDGSRNATTRFKGYHGFRKAAQALNAEAPAIAEETLQPYLAKAN